MFIATRNIHSLVECTFWTFLWVYVPFSKWPYMHSKYFIVRYDWLNERLWFFLYKYCKNKFLLFPLLKLKLTLLIKKFMKWSLRKYRFSFSRWQMVSNKQLDLLLHLFSPNITWYLQSFPCFKASYTNRNVIKTKMKSKNNWEQIMNTNN